MKQPLYLTLMYVLLFSLIFIGCVTEPKDDPTLMELLKGRYSSQFDITKGNLIIGELNTKSSTHQLTLNPDYSFTVYIEGTLPNTDSIIVIEQKGTFDILNPRYDPNTNCHSFFCRPYYVGDIWFYSEDGEVWGGRFTCSIEDTGWEFISWRKFITDDGVELAYVRWDKVGW